MGSILICLSEILCSAIAYSSPIVPNWIIILFALVMAVKVAITNSSLINKDIYSSFLIFTSCFMVELGVMLKFLAGNTSGIIKMVIMLTIGIAGGLYISKLIYKECTCDKKIFGITMNPLLLKLTFCLAVMAVLSFTPAVENGDGKIKVISIQMPELIKVFFVIFCCVLSDNFKRKNIFVFWGVSAILILSVLFGIKETGTSLLLVYFTIFATFFFSVEFSGNDEYEKNRLLKFMYSNYFPAFLMSGVFCLIGTVRKILYHIFPLRGTIGEQYMHVYYNTENGKNRVVNWLFEISSRLSGDKSQTVYAGELFWKQMPVKFQFSSFSNVIYDSQTKVSLCDYILVTLAQGVGKYAALFIIELFIVSLILAIIKCSIKGKFAASMLAIQSFMPVSGILLHFCFTGINIPFISSGGSSMMSSAILLIIILADFKKQFNQKKTENYI